MGEVDWTYLKILFFISEITRSLDSIPSVIKSKRWTRNNIEAIDLKTISNIYLKSSHYLLKVPPPQTAQRHLSTIFDIVRQYFKGRNFRGQKISRFSRFWPHFAKEIKREIRKSYFREKWTFSKNRESFFQVWKTENKKGTQRK